MISPLSPFFLPLTWDYGAVSPATPPQPPPPGPPATPLWTGFMIIFLPENTIFSSVMPSRPKWERQIIFCLFFGFHPFRHFISPKILFSKNEILCYGHLLFTFLILFRHHPVIWSSSSSPKIIPPCDPPPFIVHLVLLICDFDITADQLTFKTFKCVLVTCLFMCSTVQLFAGLWLFYKSKMSDWYFILFLI